MSFTDEAIWASGFQTVIFPKLKELDLRACSIETISANAFPNMPNLEALYLGENEIITIDSDAFAGLNSLVHLDISRNVLKSDEAGVLRPLLFESTGTFENLENLQSLDLSFTVMNGRNIGALVKVKTLTRLSLCWTGIGKLREGTFNGTSLAYLDLSGNIGILADTNALEGIERTLKVLYVTDASVDSFDAFAKLRFLEVLKLTNNEITLTQRNLVLTLRRLQILDLDRNRFVTWFLPLFSGMRSLQYLSLRDNSISVISEEMIQDVRNIAYIGLSGNFIVCNCHSRELIEMAVINERKPRDNKINMLSDLKYNLHPSIHYHTALQEYNDIITMRNNVSYVCMEKDNCTHITLTSDSGKFLLIDYEPEYYTCIQAAESNSIPFTKVMACNHRELAIQDIKKGLYRGANLLLILLIPGFILPTMLIMYIFRRKLRFFYVAMRNSATLSLISNDEVIDGEYFYIICNR